MRKLIGFRFTVAYDRYGESRKPQVLADLFLSGLRLARGVACTAMGCDQMYVMKPFPRRLPPSFPRSGPCLTPLVDDGWPLGGGE